MLIAQQVSAFEARPRYERGNYGEMAMALAAALWCAEALTGHLRMASLAPCCSAPLEIPGLVPAAGSLS